jgi:hypothetical protein
MTIEEQFKENEKQPIAKIRKYLIDDKVWSKNAKFVLASEGCVYYKVLNDDKSIVHEICVINESASFNRSELVSDLIDGYGYAEALFIGLRSWPTTGRLYNPIFEESHKISNSVSVSQ